MTEIKAESLERMKRKIAQLLAMAKDSSTTDAEKNAFMAKAQEMMERYQLDIQDVAGAEDLMSVQPGQQGIYTANMWAKTLVHVVAQLYGCRALFKGKIRNLVPYDLYGRESARITTELMLPFIVKQVRQQAKKLVLAGIQTQSIAERQVANALIGRIQEMLATRSKELVEAEQASKEHMLACVEGVTNNKGRRKTGTTADAREAAGNISLHRQTAGGGRGPLMLGGG